MRPPAKCFWCESKKLECNHQTIDPNTGRLACPILRDSILKKYGMKALEYTKRKDVQVMANASKDTKAVVIDYGL